jgi:predicted transcriptional regulator
MIPKQKMAERLRNRRNEKNLSQKEVAEETGITPSQLSKIENNRGNPTYKRIYEVWNSIETLNTDHDTAEELMISERDIYWAKPSDSINKISKVMYNNDFSQVPVGNKDKVLGTITDQTVMRADSEDTVEEVMERKFPQINKETKVHVVKEHLAENKAVLVEENNEIIGMVTPFDVMKYKHDLKDK